MSSIENLKRCYLTISIQKDSPTIYKPCCHESPVIRGVVAGEPVVGAVVPAVPPVVEVELGALVLQRVHAGIDVDQELNERITVNAEET